jgi:homoserine kinase type II
MSKAIIDFQPFLEQYALPAPIHVEQQESGMNNTTRIVHAQDKRYVLRIYNNHKNPEIVLLEHEMLLALQRQPLSFQIPLPVKGDMGHTVTVMDDGTVAALYHYIEGDRPSAAHPPHVYALGQTAARLMQALSGIKLESKPLYSPYYELEATYSGMSSPDFLALAEQSAELAARRELLLQLAAERELALASCEALSRLPKQWIHGDLVFNNTVSVGDDIVGVLDFEFVTIDARAMELAVILVDLIRPEDEDCLEKVQQLLNGYMQSFSLTEPERQALPALMKLRLLDVALHFAVRLRDGLDSAAVMCGIVDHAAFGCKWINEQWEVVQR